MFEIGTIAAMKREIWPLVKDWQASEREHEGRRFRFFEKETQVAVCGGMGAEAARRATEAVIALYAPRVVESVGFAGALERGRRVGDVLEVRFVIDAADGSRVDTGSGSATLVSFATVAGSEQKGRLAKAYGAQAVDMEAAAVAKSAEAHGLRFAATKVISDEIDSHMPPMERFTTPEGGFRTGAFVMYAAVRPWLWATVIRLGRDSAKASRALCERLERDPDATPRGAAGRESTALGGRTK